MRWMTLLAVVLCGTASLAGAAPLTLDILHITRDEEPPIPFSFMEPVPEGDGVEGARLGLADNNATGRFTGASGSLRELVVPRDGTIADTPELAALLAAGPHVVVADLALADLQALLALPGTADDILVNARATDDVLRREGCQANLFHTAVSRAMKADGLAQYLVLMGWKHWFLLIGPAPADEDFAAAIRRSATRFGARVTVEKRWTYEVGHRRTDSGVTNAREEIRPLTRVEDHDVLVVADEADDFGEYLPYRTALPRPVAGTHGLVATGWSRANEQWGGTQLQRRFEKLAGRFMTERDYANWLAVRALGEALTRAGTSDVAALRAALLASDFAIAGFKGTPLSFRPWDRQMRQPILLATTRSLVAVAPEAGFLHRVTPLDTLGDDEPESTCRLRG